MRKLTLKWKLKYNLRRWAVCEGEDCEGRRKSQQAEAGKDLLAQHTQIFALLMSITSLFSFSLPVVRLWGLAPRYFSLESRQTFTDNNVSYMSDGREPSIFTFFLGLKLFYRQIFKTRVLKKFIKINENSDRDSILQAAFRDHLVRLCLRTWYSTLLGNEICYTMWEIQPRKFPPYNAKYSLSNKIPPFLWGLSTANYSRRLRNS